ncbi:uncharacterized protein A1O9_12679 [Exophiala aquamarina CBS 119918]|uniref:Uncharacterized protein n=1 Tax=Exophiala aquamarina CBS 119918 TaxID=1182545 RepID=A0A072NU01_9EURO|nr:uncharacterized protein A1O9_12679 [Exophiala aquamarina CBS 119918]KEF51329.1 hypothetical protein A1O9_12679 [Exophiala aquamarina CBS 119918]
MAVVETIPNQHAVKTAFEHPIYASDGSALPFSALFDNHSESSTPPDRILVIFIRHFFCGNCQEYIRRLSSLESPFHPSNKSHSAVTTQNFSKPAKHPLPSVIIVGPGLPTLIATYIRITQCAFPVYCDPTTQLYDLLGMHRTLSLGHKSPVYIQHSLFSGAVKSALQIVRRVGNGDATGGGDWNINGGEFLFVQPRLHVNGSKSRSPSRSAGGRAPSSTRATASSSVSSSSSGSTLGWEISWCHRMLNSRDHTELHQLHYNTCFSPANSSRTPSPPRSILVNGNRQPQPQRSQTLPIASTESFKSYSNDCQGSCPGPDIPRSRDEVRHHRSQSPAAGKRPNSRSRSRSTSTGASTIASIPRPRSSASRAMNHHRNDSEISASIKEAQPRKSFSDSIMEKVGGLVRAKSLTSKSSNRHTADDSNIVRRPSTRSQNHEPQRPRMSLSLARAKLALRANAEPLSSTPNTSSFPRPPPPQPESDSSSASRPGGSTEVRKLIPTPLRPRSRSRSKSRSQSNSKRPTSLRNEDEIDMDENGIMIVDGVEFVNVISVQARVDAIAATPNETKPQRAAPSSDKSLSQQRVTERQQAPTRSQPLRNQGYTRGSVGLNLLTDRSTAAVAARLAATSTPKIGTGEALGIVGENPHQGYPLLHHHQQHGGFRSSMTIGLTASAPAISSH